MLFMAIASSFCEHLEDQLPSKGPSHFFGDKADGIKNKSITVNNASYEELYWLSILSVRGKFSTEMLPTHSAEPSSVTLS